MTQPANKRNDHLGDGVATVFPFTFPIPHSSHLKVVVAAPNASADTTLYEGIDYTVQRTAAGGTVTLLLGPLAAGWKLSNLLRPAIVQDENIKNNGSYFREAQEKSHDSRVRQLLGLADDVERSIRLPETEAGTPEKTVLPALSQRINRYLYCDGSGKITAVTAAPAGGGGGDAQRSDYQGAIAALAEDTPTNFEIVPMPGQTTVALGFGVEIELGVTVPGVYDVTLYADPARTREIADYVFDTTQKSYDTVAFGFVSSDASGKIYGKAQNRAGGGPSDVTVSVKMAAVALVGSISASTLQASLAASSGLEFVVESLVTVLRAKTKALGGVQRGVDGLEADATVLRTSGVGQTKSDLLTFAGGIKLAKAGTAGPPTSGSHTAGELHMDSNASLWKCIADGTPGTWTFCGSRRQTFSGVTGSAAAGASVNLELATYARAGIILRARFWPYVSDGAAAFDLSYLVRLFSKESRHGRDQLGLPIEGDGRHILNNASEPLGEQTISVASLGSLMPGDFVFINDYIAGNVSEFNRLAEVTTAPALLLENGLLAAINASCDITTVEEISSVGWWNDSLTPAEQFKLFLSLKNRHASLAASFRYEIELLNMESHA